MRGFRILGKLSREGGILAFQPSEFLTGSGSLRADLMPHAGTPLALLQFMRLGRRKEREYLTKRGKPWPRLDFDLLAR